jgi:Tfp pilus assembly protein PilO
VNRRTLAIVGAAAGAALILLAYVLIVRSIAAERQARVGLQAQIEPFETALDAQQQGADVLPTREAELKILQTELAAIQFAFPSEVDSTEVLNYVIASAGESGVSLQQLEAQEPITETIGEDVYRLYAYDVEVEGTLEATSAFLAALERKAIKTMGVDRIYMEAQPTPGTYRTELVVLVYVRPGEEQGSSE